MSFVSAETALIETELAEKSGCANIACGKNFV